jgi:hypothetical protein
MWVISGGRRGGLARLPCEAALYVESGEGVGHELDGFAHALRLVGHEQRRWNP